MESDKVRASVRYATIMFAVTLMLSSCNRAPTTVEVLKGASEILRLARSYMDSGVSDEPR